LNGLSHSGIASPNRRRAAPGNGFSVLGVAAGVCTLVISLAMNTGSETLQALLSVTRMFR